MLAWHLCAPGRQLWDAVSRPAVHAGRNRFRLNPQRSDHTPPRCQKLCAVVWLFRTNLKDHVRRQIGALATPDMIRFSNALPKTRSGKIMRRLLRDIAAGREKIGDTTTLEDYSVLARLRAGEE